MGLFNSGATVHPALSLIANWFDEKRGMLTSIVMTCTSAGTMLGGLIIPRVIESIGWQNGYRVLGLSFLLLSLPLGLFVIVNTPMEVGLLPFGHKETAREENDQAQAPRAIPGVTFSTAIKSPVLYLLFAGLLFLGVPSACHTPGYCLRVGIPHIVILALFLK